MAQVSREELGIGQTGLTLEIDAPRERVWRALTEEIGQWWLPDFYAGGEATKAVILEPRVGGRLYEDWGDGGGLLWYTVIALQPPRSIDLAGHLTPAFGGPAKTYLKLELEEAGGKTRLVVSDAVLGRTSEGAVEQMRSGWQMLFGDGLKAHVEKG